MRSILKNLTHAINKKKLFQGYQNVSADKLEKASLFLGIFAILFILIPANTIFLAVPLGILAIVCEKQAAKNVSTKEKRAGLGKTMGIFALAYMAIEILLALILIVIR
jgi:hypothetical protein